MLSDIELRYSWSFHRRRQDVLTDPKWNHYPPLNIEAAVAHYTELISRFRARQERPETRDVDDDKLAQWLKDVIEASEFPF